MDTFVLTLKSEFGMFYSSFYQTRPLKSQNINVKYDTQGNVCSNTFHSILL